MNTLDDEIAKILQSDDLDYCIHWAMRWMEQGVLDINNLITLTNRLALQNRLDQSVALYRRWILLTDSPLRYAAYFNLGVDLSRLGDRDGTIEAYRKAIELNHYCCEARINLGTELEAQGNIREALFEWLYLANSEDIKGVVDSSFMTRALNNAGRVLENIHEYAESEARLKESLLINPKQPDALQHWVHLRQKQCKWPIYQPFGQVTEYDMIRATSALAMLSASGDPALQLEASRKSVNDLVKIKPASLTAGVNYRHERLRIGYLSSDFRMHAVGLLTAQLYELHDRSRFEVYGFCWSNDDHSPLRARIIKGMDVLVRIKDMSDQEAAECIRSHEIDILIDLQGITDGSRPSILAYRPAPIQVTYLGFPGSTGMPDIDYVIADQFVLPEALLPFFTEKPLYMPQCFQISDTQRTIAPMPKRSDYGLPDDRFIYCCFNHNHKITPEVFTVWMKILQRAPDSVLWLLSDNRWAEENMIEEARRRGIPRERLYFSGRVMPAEYLARYQLADLFLDTLPFNGGTTANDALWMGLPLLTCAGRTFASRMAGSLLRSVGLSELVAETLQDYEEVGVWLAQNPERITLIKQHLKSVRDTCPLFDNKQFVRNLENLFIKVVQEQSGQVPVAIPDKAITSVDWSGGTILPPLTQGDPHEVVSFTSLVSWGVSDPALFNKLIGEAIKLTSSGVFLGDNLLTWGRNNSLLDDQAFRQSWESNARNYDDNSIAWRRYILACAAYHCVQLPGDFVECGVYLGTGMKTVIDYFGRDVFCKRFWGYDAFDYNQIGSIPGMDANHDLYREVSARFEHYPMVRLIRDKLPEGLEKDAPTQIAYLHLDLYDIKQEGAVLDRLFDKVVAGGIIILDHYEWAGEYRQQKLSQDAWFSSRNYRIFPLPTGQGLVLKR